MKIASAAMLLFFIMDPVGNVPTFMALLKGVEPERQRRIIVRECFFAYGVLLVFLFGGRFVLELFQIRGPALGMAGGIILFLIAIRMIFPSKNGIFGEAPEEEPFIVPLAVPLIAGPSAMATVMLLATREPEHIFGAWLIALTCAWLLSFLILSQAATLSKWLGERFLGGLSRLMGMLLTAIAVQSFLEGLRLFLAELG